MKYISRITALLLALMMLTPTFASALTLENATQSDLDIMYQAASEDEYYYVDAGLLGAWTKPVAFANLADKENYTFQWYDAQGNTVDSYEEPWKMCTTNTMAEQRFYCIATPVTGTGEALKSAIFVVPPADIGFADDYLNYLYYTEDFIDVFGAADTLTLYRLMTEDWNVSMPDGANLAQSILELWWSEREESYFDAYMFCSCVITGAVDSTYCILHPNSDLHVDGCTWKQYEITADVDVSTPESLLTLESVTPAAVEREDAESYAWQNYIYDETQAGMRWEVVDYVLETNLYPVPINKDSIQTAYRVVVTTDADVFESKPFYLGGYDFFDWILTADGIQAWMADESVTLADVVARYNEEKDRVNADDYTYGEEGESVNLKVPEGAFDEPYIMEIETTVPSDDTVNAVLQSMDATGTHEMQVLTAFDISFAALADRTRKLQPAEGTSVALTFEVDTTGLSEDLKYLYVYHIANDGTPEVVAGPIDATFGVQQIEVQADGFSTYLAMATNDFCPYCVLHDYCVYYDLYVYDAEKQYEMLATAGDSDGYFNDTTYDNIIADYKNHIAAGETPILCTCVLMTKGTLVEPGDEHTEDCLWVGTILRVVGLYGEQANLTFDEEIVNAGNYTYQWYHGDEAIDNATGWQYMVNCTMQTETYYWIATPVDGGEPIKSGAILVTAQWTSLGEYIMYAVDHYGETNEELYNYLTETLDVDFTAVVDNVEVEKNLADEIMSFWYDKCLADEEYLYTGIFCTCVVSGVISSDECMLHPDALHNEECPWYTEVEVIIPPTPDQPPLYNGEPNGAQYTSTETYTLPMGDDRAVILPKGGRAVIKSNQTVAGQWQVYTGEVWVDIQGETNTEIAVTEAMLNTIFELTGVAQMRYYDKDNNVVLASVSVTSQEIAGGEYPELTAQARELIAMPRAAWENIPDSDDTTNTVTINYVLNDTVIRANMVGQYGVDQETVTFSVASPEVVGYKPFIYDYDDEGNFTAEEATVIDYDGPLDGDRVYTVVYEPDYVKYTIRYMLQDLNDPDEYIENEALRKVITTKKTGDIASLTAADIIDIDGFYYIMNTDNAEIVATGTTTLEIYYNRAYYLMNFELNGGYGVEPIYAPYEAPITVGTPTRPGYQFDGWTPAVPGTIPVNGGTYTAKWTAQNAKYTVVFWYENANDANYSVAGTITVDAKSGDTVNSDMYRSQTGFTGADTTHFTYNANRAETETVAGDDSTVLDVYFTRNTYTITFSGVTELNCTRNHTHGNSCYKSIAYSVTAKYDSDITHVWQNDPIKSMLDRYYVFKSSITSKYYSFLEKMPGYSLTMTATDWSDGWYTYKWYYYLEVLPGKTYTETTRQDGGKTYYEYDSTTVRGSGLSLTYDEDYFPITGFKQRDSEVPSFNNRIAYLYYVRESYDLTFMNYGTEVTDKGGTFLYEADISGTGFTPAYPTDQLEAGAYVFEGWYTDPYFKGEKFVFTGATMPAQDLTLFAHWVPVNHNVNIYKTSALNAGDKIGETQVIMHGGKATAPAQPIHPEYRDYEFVGWFYMDNGTEKAFNFENMTVRKDMDVYAKWSSTTLVDYTIRYVDKNTGEEIAPATTRTGLAGTNPEVFPKKSDELDEGYQEGWFPEIVSDTIELSSARENVYTFYYINRGKVPYTVYYLAADPLETTTILGSKVVNDVEYKIIAATENKETSNIAVTETAKNIPQYLPTKYQETLIIGGATGAVNEICFFYKVNKDSAYGSITHYIEDDEGEYTDKAGKKWSKYTQRFESGKVGNTLSATSISIQDYTYDPTAVDQVLEGKLTIDPMLELKVFYTENEVMINYEVVCPAGAEEACKVSRPSEYVKVRTGDAKGSTASTTSEAYEFVGWFETPYGTDEALTNNAYYQPQKVGIKHVAKTYYARFVEKEATITYVPVGNGTVSQTSETLKVLSGVATGSVAITAENHHFVGWYDNEACEGEALSTDVGYVPVKPGTMWEDATYYAKFEENEVTITYIPVGPNGANDGAGTVTPTSETLKVATDEAQGSTAAASSNTYTFVGWYSDVSCADDKWLSSDAKYVPSKVDGLNVAATYYAKFEYNVSNLTITKDGMSNGESAIVEVVITPKDGTAEDAQTYTIVFNENTTRNADGIPYVTIGNVLIGSTYEVTEQTAWSWRYTLGSPVYTTQNKTIVADATKNLVTIENKRTNDKWLSDESAIENNLDDGTRDELNNQ